MELDLISKEETQRLEELEAVIRRDLKGFVRVGMALKEIRDSRLYRGKYTTWKDYLKAEWDISKVYAKYLTDASTVVMNLEKVHNCEPFDILPMNESQTRPLTLLSDEQQIAAWKQVLMATGGQVTALAVNKVVMEILEAQLTEEKQVIQKSMVKEITVPDDFSSQFSKLIEILDLHRKANWKDFNRKKALEFIRAIEEYLNS